MKGIELNEVYAFFTPKKFLNIIIVNDDISEETHKNIDLLAEHSSIFFIFRNYADSKIDYRKFTKLYRGCGFIVANASPDLSKGDKLPVETLFKTLLYCKEVFEIQNIGITHLSNLEGFSVKDYFGKVEKLLVKQLGAAVLDITRIEFQELRYYYTIDESEEKKTAKLTFWKGKKWEDGDDILWHAYKTHYSNSKVIFLPISVVSQLMEAWIEDKKNMIKSFKDCSCDFIVFASLIHELHLQYVNSDILDLEI